MTQRIRPGRCLGEGDRIAIRLIRAIVNGGGCGAARTRRYRHILAYCYGQDGGGKEAMNTTPVGVSPDNHARIVNAIGATRCAGILDEGIRRTSQGKAYFRVVVPAYN